MDTKFNVELNFKSGCFYADIKVANNLLESQSERTMHTINNTLIDSGADVSIFSDYELKDFMKFPTGKFRQLSGITGNAFNAEIFKLPVLIIGNARLLDIPVCIYPFKSLGKNKAILGMDILKKLDIEIINETNTKSIMYFKKSKVKNDRDALGLESELKIFSVESEVIVSDTEFEESLREYEREFMSRANHTLEEIQDYINKRG